MGAQVIEVTPASGQGGAIDWTLCYNQKCGGAGNYPAVDLAAKSGAHMMIVTIKDPANLGIGFDPQDPLWIQANSKPTGPIVGPNSQISDVTRANKITLVFMDKNKGPGMTLKYQLNFVGADNQKVTPIDPDIRNGGGTVALFGAAEAAAFFIGAAVSLVLAVLWFRRVAARRNPAA